MQAGSALKALKQYMPCEKNPPSNHGFTGTMLSWRLLTVSLAV